jgi:hypothetical protein
MLRTGCLVSSVHECLARTRRSNGTAGWAPKASGNRALTESKDAEVTSTQLEHPYIVNAPFRPRRFGACRGAAPLTEQRAAEWLCSASSFQRPPGYPLRAPECRTPGSPEATARSEQLQTLHRGTQRATLGPYSLPCSGSVRRGDSAGPLGHPSPRRRIGPGSRIRWPRGAIGNAGDATASAFSVEPSDVLARDCIASARGRLGNRLAVAHSRRVRRPWLGSSISRVEAPRLRCAYRAPCPTRRNDATVVTDSVASHKR